MTTCPSCKALTVHEGVCLNPSCTAEPVRFTTIATGSYKTVMCSRCGAVITDAIETFDTGWPNQIKHQLWHDHAGI